MEENNNTLFDLYGSPYTRESLFFEIEDAIAYALQESNLSILVDSNNNPYRSRDDFFNDIKNEINNFLSQNNQNNQTSQTLSEEEKQRIADEIKNQIMASVSNSNAASFLLDENGIPFNKKQLDDQYSLLIDQKTAYIKANVLIGESKDYSLEEILNHSNEIINSQKQIIEVLQAQIGILNQELIKQKENVSNIISNDDKTATAISGLNNIIRTFKPFKKIN